MLTGKYLPGQALPEGSRATDEQGGAETIRRYLDDDILTAVQKLKPIAEEQELTLAQLAIAWVLQNQNVATALVGASRPEQITSNVAAAGVTLDESTMEAIDSVIGHLAQDDPSLTKSPESRMA